MFRAFLGLACLVVAGEIGFFWWLGGHFHWSGPILFSIYAIFGTYLILTCHSGPKLTRGGK